MNNTLLTLTSIAKDAASVVMGVYERPFSVDYKGPEDPVTEADRRANQLICARLSQEFPNIPIVAEESPPEEWEGFRKAERVFFVDPVDGTREFVAKSGDFVVMIGMLEGDHPKHGVLLAPTTGTIWAGTVGEGAWKMTVGSAPARLSLLSAKSLAEARVVSSKSRQTELNTEALRRLGAREVEPLGSSGLKGAAIADASADIYLAPQFAGCRWDSCAPEALVRAVGGHFSDAHGFDLDYRAPGVENDRGTVAAAPGLHEEVIERLSGLFR